MCGAIGNVPSNTKELSIKYNTLHEGKIHKNI
jgi:hypothetical protein